MRTDHTRSKRKLARMHLMMGGAFQSIDEAGFSKIHGTKRAEQMDMISAVCFMVEFPNKMR